MPPRLAPWAALVLLLLAVGTPFAGAFSPAADRSSGWPLRSAASRRALFRHPGRAAIAASPPSLRLASSDDEDGVDASGTDNNNGDGDGDGDAGVYFATPVSSHAAPPEDDGPTPGEQLVELMVSKDLSLSWLPRRG